MTHLDPDPLYVEEDGGWEECECPWFDSITDERSTPSLTIPLVLLCAVVGALFVAWLVTR